VIAGASSAAKCDLCLRLGADAAINYAQDNIREALKQLTGGKGPDIVYDPVGGDLAEPCLRSLAWRGRYLVVGFAQGGIPALPWNLPLLKGTSIVGVFWGEFVRREPEANARSLQALVRWYLEGKVKPVIDQVLPMARLHDAYARMSSRQALGKLVMVNA
jgi:NADPH:quinone reductase